MRLGDQEVSQLSVAAVLNSDGRGWSWGRFDKAAAQLVKKEISFEDFSKAVKVDVSRMARAAVRRRRPRTMTKEDLEIRILSLVWYYAFKHVCRTGEVGFDPKKHNSPGAYLRFNAAQHLQKEIGKDRGENMHSHRMFGNPTESLTSEGDIEQVRSFTLDSQEGSVEVEIDNHRRRDALERITKATKEFIVQAEVEKTFRKPAKSKAGQKTRVQEFLLGPQTKEVRSDLKTLGIRTGDELETVDCVSEFITRALGSTGAAASSEAKTSQEEVPSSGAHPEK